MNPIIAAVLDFIGKWDVLEIYEGEDISWERGWWLFGRWWILYDRESYGER